MNQPAPDAAGQSAGGDDRDVQPALEVGAALGAHAAKEPAVGGAAPQEHVLTGVDREPLSVEGGVSCQKLTCELMLSLWLLLQKASAPRCVTRAG